MQQPPDDTHAANAAAPFEAARRAEYERWLGGRSVSATVLRAAMTPFGQYLVNTPLYRLPESLHITPRQRLLDIGCGRGGLLRVLSGRVPFEQPPVGVDFSGAVLALAARDAARAGIPLHFVHGTATALPLADRSFDIVTCGYVIKHLSDDELRHCLDEVQRVLAPGGLAVLWDFAPVHDARLNVWNKRVMSAGGVQDPRLRSTRRLLRFAEEAGFSFVRRANLRPFLLPPIPRASVLVGIPPEHWDGTRPLEYED